jgi:hypothetical protein
MAAEAKPQNLSDKADLCFTAPAAPAAPAARVDDPMLLLQELHVISIYQHYQLNHS